MIMEQVEELQVSIETKLYEINLYRLRDVAEYLMIEDTDGKSKLFIIRRIREELEKNIEASEIVGQGDSVVVLRYLTRILAYLKMMSHQYSKEEGMKTKKKRQQEHLLKQKRNTKDCKMNSWERCLCRNRRF